MGKILGQQPFFAETWYIITLQNFQNMPNVTVDVNLNNGFKLALVFGSSFFPLAKQDFIFRKVLYNWVDMKKLDLIAIPKYEIFNSPNLLQTEKSCWKKSQIWLDSVPSTRLRKIEQFNLKFMLIRSLALFKSGLTIW